MSVRRSIPLAWRNLTESPWRLAASVAGTAFAVVLMFSQIGFRGALLDNMAAVISHLDGELFVINRERYILSTPAAFPRRRLDLVRSQSGVADARPFYVETRPTTRWRNVATGVTRPIRVLAFDPRDELLDLPAVRDQRDAWAQPRTALADRRSKASIFGPIATGTRSELNGQRIEVVGEFGLGTDFRSSGTLLLSAENLLRYVPIRRAATEGDMLVDVGVVRLAPGFDTEKVRRALAEGLTPDLAVLSKPEFVAKEQRFWENVAPIGVVFDIGLVLGFVVGMGICYQVLFSEISDRLAEFATLKAMGYTDRGLVLVIVREGVILAGMGYVVGLGISLGLFRWLAAETGLTMALRPASLGIVLGLTVLMCVASGLLAGRRLTSADPAELFS